MRPLGCPLLSNKSISITSVYGLFVNLYSKTVETFFLLPSAAYIGLLSNVWKIICIYKIYINRNEQVRGKVEVDRESASRVDQIASWWFGNMEWMTNPRMSKRMMKQAGGECEINWDVVGWMDGLKWPWVAEWWWWDMRDCVQRLGISGVVKW